MTRFPIDHSVHIPNVVFVFQKLSIHVTAPDFSGHEPQFSSDSASTPYDPEDSMSVIEESHSRTTSWTNSGSHRIHPQMWKCEECNFSNFYVSEACISCHHPTPKNVVEGKGQSDIWEK